MKIKENHCVGCDGRGLPCLGSACSNSRIIESIVCDECGESLLPIYHYEGKELCAKCIIKDLDLEEVE